MLYTRSAKKTCSGGTRLERNDDLNDEKICFFSQRAL